MGGVNTAAIASIVNALYPLIVMIGVLISVWMFYSGIRSLSWSSQLSMGMASRSMASEGFSKLIGGIVAGQASWFAWAGGREFMGVNTSWVPLSSNSTSLEFIGNFLTSAFYLIGISMIIKAGMMLPKVSQGQATIGQAAVTILIGSAVANFQWLNAQVASLTPFNPLGLFMPNTGVISL